MESKYEAIMTEFNANNDAVATLCAQRSDKDMTIHLAEAHLRNTEVALQTESQQRELAMTMAREVSSGQAAVLRQFEQQMERNKVERTAQASRVDSVIIDTGRQVGLIESLLRETQLKSEEYAQLILGLVSVAYALEGEA
jgi:hypothetical protein